MKKRLLLFCLMFAFFTMFKMQTLLAQNYAATLPGGATGSTSNITIPDLPLTSLPFTVEMLFKPVSKNNYGALWSDRSGASPVNLQYENNVNYLRVDYGGTSNVLTALSFNGLPYFNQWNHIALIITSTYIRVILNGTVYEKTGMTNTFVPFNGPSYIGWDNAAANRTINGQFDEIRFWSTERTPDQIAANRFTSLTGTETGLMAYYNFNGQNANDVTSNAANATANGATYTALATNSADLTNIALSAGILNQDFINTTTTYNALVPPDVASTVVTGYPDPYIAPVTSNGATLNATTTNASLVVNSVDATTSKTYTVNFLRTTIDDWDGNGATGIRSIASLWGWNCSNSSTAFTAAGSGACRFNDITTGWYFNNITTPWTGRALYIRWDGSGATTTSSVFTYAVYLQSCKTYSFTYKYTWANNASSPLLTYGFASDKAGASIIVSDTAQCSATKQLFKSKSLLFTPSSAGIYYIFMKAPVAALCAVADLTMTEYAGQILSASPSTLSLSDGNKSVEITVTGNALASDVTLSAPAGITLSRTTVPVSETQCGGKVTATYDYTQNIASGNITLTSGGNSATVPFTFTNPTISIGDKNVNVENISRAHPVIVKSVNNSVDSIYVSVTDGFSLVKRSYSLTDFTNGSGSIKVGVNTNAAIGTTGKVIFFYKRGGVVYNLDTVNVTSVAAFTRYYIKHKTSQLVIGNQSTNVGVPALTTLIGDISQKFVFRPFHPGVNDSIYYVEQDGDYRKMRKSTANGWDVEFGAPAAEAIWRLKLESNGAYSLMDSVTKKVLGTDDTIVNSRLYCDKAYVPGALVKPFSEWLLVALAIDATLSDLKVNGTTVTGFSSATTSYDIELPVGTTAVPAVTGTSTDAKAKVDITAAAALPGSTIVTVTAEDGAVSKTYSVNFTVAKSTIATLSSLTVNGTSVAGFANNVYSYNVNLPYGTTTVPTVVGTATDSKANVVVTPPSSLPGATTVLVTAEDGTTKLTYTINFTVGVGVLAIKGLTINVYPTITSGNFTAETNGKLGTLTVLDITGKVVSKQVATSSIQTVNVAIPGIYLIKVECNGITKIFKVVKTK